MIQVLSVRGRGGVRPGGVYVGRATPRYPASVLGNPFHIGQHGARAEVVARDQTSSCGVNSTVFGKHRLDERPCGVTA